MNKRDREQLRASIAKDLVQGQGEHSPTKELLRQYTPLEASSPRQMSHRNLGTGLAILCNTALPIYRSSRSFIDLGFCNRGQRVLPIRHPRPIDDSNVGIATFKQIGFKRLVGRTRPSDASKSGQTMLQVTPYDSASHAWPHRPSSQTASQLVGVRRALAVLVNR